MLAFLWLVLTSTALAERVIRATSLVPCMEQSAVQASRFDVVFTPDNRTLSYDVSVDVQINGNVYAEIVLYAYGFAVIHERLDPCTSSDLKQLCPLTTGEIDIVSTATVSASVVRDIPGIAFSVPNIDAFAVVKVYTTTDNVQRACIRAELTNDKTVEQVAVKWVTAVLSGLGLLASAVLTFFGSSWTAQHIAATTGLMFSYFQSIIIIDMQAVERVPPIASAWAEDIAWSVGLIRTEFMQKIFRWYVQATGGTPSTYMIYSTVAVLIQRQKKRAMEMLGKAVPPRVADFAEYQLKQHASSAYNVLNTVASMAADAVGGEDLYSGADLYSGLAKRENELAKETFAQSSAVLVVMRGIKRAAYQMGIENTSIVLTTFTMFTFVCVCVAVLFAFVYLAFFLMRRGSKNFDGHHHASHYLPLLPSILKGTILKLVLMGFPSLILFSFWEFVQQDSAGVIVVAVFFLILPLGILGWNTYRMVMLARKSERETGTAAFLLYSHAPTMHRYGFLYQQFQARYYFFAVIYLVYHIVVAAFIAFAQSQGKVQGLAMFIIELILLILVCHYKPFMNKSTNVINIAMQVIKMINALFFLFFSNLMTQPLAVNAVMGVVFFVLNAAFSLILLLYTIIYCTIMAIRKNPDARMDPAKDDRQSFISEKGPIERDAADELAALGHAAQDGHEHPNERPEWFEDERGHSGNPFEHQQLPTPGTRDSRTLSERTNTMTSVPTYDDVDARVKHYRGESQVSFGLGSSSHGQQAEAGKKKWWQLT